MEIRPLEVDNRDEFDRFHAIVDAAERYERPFAAMWSLEEARIEFTDHDPGMRIDAIVAVDDGEIIGAGAAFATTGDNLHAAYLMPWVAPELRRRGIGSAILSELVSLCRNDNRTDLIIETAYDVERQEDHPYRRFAEKHGFVLANREIRRVLELPVEESLLDSLAAEAAERHPGYRIETYDGPIPDALVPSLCHARNQLGVDAPTGLMEFEPETLTPDLLRHREETLRRQGRTMISTLAIHGADEVVGYNDLVIPSGDVPNVYQWGTLVLRAHRGHRLGLAVKVRGLRELQRRIGPERTRVETCNAEQNSWMVGINERLGFRIVEISPSFLLRLPASG
jgi:GNAT superfamily N-acetyltransferase